MNCLFYSLCGYHNAHAFASFDESDYNYIEMYVKTKLPDLLEKISLANGHEQFNEDDGVFFYSHFSVDKTSFEITKGERRLIDTLVLYISNKAKEDETHFEFREAFGRRARNEWVKGLYQTCVGYFFGYERKLNTARRPFQPSNLETHRTSLFSKAKMAFEAHAKKFGLKEKQTFGMDLVKVEIINGAVRGKVRCTFCEPTSEKGEVGVYFKGDLNCGFWINSNLGKHISKYHYGIDQKIPQMNTPKNAVNNENTLPNQHAKSISTQNNKRELKQVHEPKSSRAILGAIGPSLYEMNHSIQIEHDQESNESLTTKLEIEPNYPESGESDRSHIADVNDSEDSDGAPYSMDSSNTDYEELDLSTSTSVEDQLHRQMIIQIIKMSNAASTNCDDLVKVTNKHLQIKICSIKADGNCLFSSIAHQLSQTVVDSQDHQQLSNDLRVKVVRHIVSNLSEYVDCIKNRFLQNDPNSKIDIEQRCIQFLDTYLSKSGFWGGVESIQAISRLYEVNIATVTEDGMCSMVQPFDSTFGRTLLVFYRGRSHYDSLIEAPEINVQRFAKYVIDSKKKSLKNKSETDVIEL